MSTIGYGQYCPVAKAAELIDQRWTLLVIRELVAGSTRFNDIHRGVPRMSRTLLSKRLRQLVADGFVQRHEHPEGPTYRLTPAGHEFRAVIEALGEWGVRWIDSLAEEDLETPSSCCGTCTAASTSMPYRRTGRCSPSPSGTSRAIYATGGWS